MKLKRLYALLLSSILLVALFLSCFTHDGKQRENDTCDTVGETTETDVVNTTEPEADTAIADTDGDFGVESDRCGAFEGALFIGDSRTVGLYQYADLSGADAFASTGLNIFRLQNESLNVDGVGNTTLGMLLESKKYDTIYVMLGINEIGYEHSAVLKKYGETVEYLKASGPESKLVLCANLHITQKRSQKDSIYNNERLNKLNEGIKSFADGERVFFVDVNPLFDDENGALSEAVAVDDFHLVGKYYGQWGRWLAAQR